jgi:adenylate cyclase
VFTLVYIAEDPPTRRPLTAGSTTIGRTARCDVVIDHPSISRQQTRFTVVRGRCTVTDLDSRNGTFVNGDPVAEREVHDGDVVTLGTFALRVEESVDEHLALSEHHTILEGSSTVFLPMDRESGPARVGQDRQFFAAMSAILHSVVAAQPLSEVLNRVVDLVFTAVNAERAFVLLRVDTSGALVPKLARHRDGCTVERATISRTVVQRVINDRVAILAQDTALDPSLATAKSLHMAGIRSFMCAPLWNETEVIGALYVDTPRSQDFSAEDLKLFSAFSEYVAVAVEQARLTGRVREELRRRERLQRYHSPAVVERILRGGDETDLQLTAVECEASILLVDIVGFTALAERLPSAQTAEMLNRFFGRMAEVIFRYDGTLDKFIGDAILAVFGAPLPQVDHRMRAVRAALDMRQSLAVFNRDAEHPLEIRIAITSGIVTAGDFGSPQRREYTVLGDVVNTCARLQSNACAPGQIVLGASTLAPIRDAVRITPLEPACLRGKRTPVEVFALEGLR